MAKKTLNKFEIQVATHIKNRRLQLGLTMRECCEKINARGRYNFDAKPGTWAKWESLSPKRHRNPPLSIFPALCFALNWRSVKALMP